MPRAKNPSNGTSTKSSARGTAATAAVRKKIAFTPETLEEEIRRRAYELYEQRGCMPGRESEDWLIAEQEVVARYQDQMGA